MSSVTGVLLGVAEVKIPLRRLPQEIHAKIAQVSHWAVVCGDSKPTQEEEIELSQGRDKFIGEIDSYYSLREVVVKVEDGQCQIIQGKDVVLQHRTSDVIIAMEESKLRVVYISRSNSFGRAAVVLQMKTQKQVYELLALFPHAMSDALDSSPQQSDGLKLPSSSVKDNKASWGKGAAKKFSAIFASLSSTGSNTQTKKVSVRSVKGKDALTPEPLDPQPPGSRPESDSDTDEEEPVKDETDNKSAGKYYEEMGLDATVQEQLYDNDASDTVSVTSDSSIESNSSIIEAEVRFFVATDADFVKSLKSLEEDRTHLASSETPQFIRETLTLLFLQVKSLIQLHSKLHTEFEESSHNLLLLSEAIIHHKSDYENYVYFMENIPTVDRILATHKDYFKNHMPELPEKLRKPRMRLHYYVLTLETLYKKSSSSEEKKALHKAMDTLKVPLKKADSKLFLGAVIGSPFDLSNYGNLIRHSDLTLRRGGDLQRRTYHVLMLKTLILLTISEGRNYRYITSFRVDEVGLGKQERGVLFTLEVRNGPRGQTNYHTFKTKNINMQQLWINDLKEIFKEKSQPPTPRNSYIESDVETRTSGKRSKVRRGQSFERSQNAAHVSVSDSDILDEDGVSQTRLNDNNGSWSGRRTAIKKNNSSASGKARPMLRQHSGYCSDSEVVIGSPVKQKNLDYPPPLSVWTVFSQFDNLYKRKNLPLGTKDSYQISVNTLLTEEKKYIEELNEQLKYFLDDTYSKPPQCIFSHLRHIYDFHANIFLPMLEKAALSMQKEEIAQCFIDCNYLLKELYASYLADRSRLNEEMKDMNLINPYIQPVLHFEMYMKYLSRLQDENDPEDPTIQAVISFFTQCIAGANTILLTETIKGAPFDLDEQGSVLFEGRAKVRWTGHMIRHDYHVVLLDTMILLLEPRPPMYEFVDAIRMDTVGLGPTSDDYSFQLEVRTVATKTLTYLFRTPTRNSKKRWMDEITQLLRQQVEQLKKKQLRRLGSDVQKLQTLERPKNYADKYNVSPRPVKRLMETDL